MGCVGCDDDKLGGGGWWLKPLFWDDASKKGTRSLRFFDCHKISCSKRCPPYSSLVEVDPTHEVQSSLLVTHNQRTKVSPWLSQNRVEPTTADTMAFPFLGIFPNCRFVYTRCITI